MSKAQNRECVVTVAAALSSLLSLPLMAAPLDLDTGFGADQPVPGFVLTPLSATVAFADVLPLVDGRVLAVGDNGAGGTTSQTPGAIMLTADGSVDTSWASNGIFSQALIAGVDVEGFARALRAPDGGFVLLAAEGGAARLDLVKLTADGTLDTNFGNGGLVSLSRSELPGSGGGFQGATGPQPIAIDTQGRILLATGYTRSTPSGLRGFHALCRFSVNGELDLTYSVDADGVDGCLVGVSDAAEDSFPEIRGMAMDGDAAIITGNVFFEGTTGRFGALRATANGSLDSGFGTGGMVKLNLPSIGGAGVAVVRRPDGRLLFLTSGSTNLLQLLPDGRIDTGFGNGNGLVASADGELPSANTRFPNFVAGDPRELALQADGRALILNRISTANCGGQSFTGPQVARVLPDGNVDTSFGETSVCVFGPQPSIGSNVQAIALADDGAIFIAGGRGGLTANTPAVFVAKLLGGSAATRVDPFLLDDQFDVPQNSTRSSNQVIVSGLPDGVPALVRQDIGRTVLNGSNNPNSGSSVGVVYNGDTLSASHTSANAPGTRVLQLVRVGAGEDEVSEVFASTTAGELACRPGDLDPAFAVDDGYGPGLRVYAGGELSTQDVSLLLQPDFRAFVSSIGRLASFNAAGTAFSLNLSRLDGTGSADTGFNGGAPLRLTEFDGSGADASGNTSVRKHDLLRLTDGRFIALLLSTDAGIRFITLARLNPDGSVDTSFASNGAAHFPLSQLGGGGNFDIFDLALQVQVDGRFLVAVSFLNSFDAAQNGVAVLRFNADGTLDDGGPSDTTPDDAWGQSDADGVDGASLIRQQPAPSGPVLRLQNGLPVLMVFSGNQDYRFYRFLANGALDPGFGSGGEALVRTNNANLSALAAQDFLVLPDGRLVFTTRTAALGRLQENGALDTSFANDGLLLRDRGGAGGAGARGLTELTPDLIDLRGQRLLRQPDGKLLVLGFDGMRTLHLARFFADGTPDLGFANDRIDVLPTRAEPSGIPNIEFFHRGFALDGAGRPLFAAHFGPNGGAGVSAPVDAHKLIVGRLCGGGSLSTRVSAFALNDLTDVATNSTQTSNTITISGLADLQPALVRVQNGTYSINGGAFTTTMEKVFNGDTVSVRHVASAVTGTEQRTTLIIGADVDEFREDFVSTTAGTAPTASPTPGPTATPAPTASPLPTATPSPGPTATPSPVPTPVPNRAPIAGDDSISVNEDEVVDIAVLANDADPDADPLAVVSFTQAQNGTVEGLAPLSLLRYTPAANFDGSDSFSYTIHDGRGGSATATVSIQVIPVNDPPLAVDDNIEIDDETPIVEIDLLANDADPDNDALRISAVTEPEQGRAIVINGGRLVRYTIPPGFVGIDRFSYMITDSQGGSDSAEVVIEIARGARRNGELRFLSNHVTASRNFASYVCLYREGSSEGAVSVSLRKRLDAFDRVAGTFNWPDGDALPLCIQDRVPNAGFALLTMSEAQGGAHIGHPPTSRLSRSEFSPIGSFRFRAPPDSSGFIVSTEAGEADGFVDLLILREGGEFLPASSVRVRTATQLRLDASATPGSDYLPLDTLVSFAAGQREQTVRVELLDDSELEGRSAESFLVVLGEVEPDPQSSAQIDTPNAVLVRIRDEDVAALPPGNRAPTAVDDGVETPIDTAVLIDVLANDSDIDGDALTLSVPDATPNATLTREGTSVRYQPSAGFIGVDRFNYTIRDPSGESASAEVVVDVQPRRDRIGFIPNSLERLSEGDRVTIAVVRTVDGSPSGLPAASVTLQLDASATEDLALSATTLNWGAGEIGTRGVSLTATDDSIIEPVENFALRLVNPVNTQFRVFSSRRDIIVVDNDRGVGFSAAERVVGIGATNPIPVLMERSGDLSETISMRIMAERPDTPNARGCLPTNAFRPLSGRMSVRAGVRQISFGVNLTRTNNSNICQYFLVRIFDASDNVQVTQGSIEIILEAPELRVVEFETDLLTVLESGCETQAPVTVTGGRSGMLPPLSIGVSYQSLETSPEDFNSERVLLTAESGASTVTLPVIALDDARVEGTERFRVRLIDPPLVFGETTPPFFFGARRSLTVAILDDDAQVHSVTRDGTSNTVLIGESTPLQAVNGCEFRLPGSTEDRLSTFVIGADSIQTRTLPTSKTNIGTTVPDLELVIDLDDDPKDQARASAGVVVLDLPIPAAISEPAYFSCIADDCAALFEVERVDASRLRVLLEDGGFGDVDGQVNGQIIHAGFVAEANESLQPDSVPTPSPASGGSGALSPVMMLWCLLLWGFGARNALRSPARRRTSG